MLRVTYNSINRDVQKIIIGKFGDLAKLQEQLSTGKRLLRPSDDPIDVANTLKMSSKVKQLEQFKRNIDDGLGFMQVTDTALMSMDSLLQRLRELAIQADSDTLSAKERKFIAQEVQQLLRQLVALTNTKYKDDYVFAGTQTRTMPFPLDASKASSPQDYTDLKMATFDATTGTGIAVPIMDPSTGRQIKNIIPGTVSFSNGITGNKYEEGVDFTIDYANGYITILPTSPNAAELTVDLSAAANYQYGAYSFTFDYIDEPLDIFGNPIDFSGKIYRQIETGITAQINITANELLVDNDTNTNMFKAIINFGQKLIQNNKANISSSITEIDNAFKNLLAAQAKNGARINRFTTTLDRNQNQTSETTRLQSELEDADLAETITNFSLAQNVYNAALQSAAKILQPSLANFL